MALLANQPVFLNVSVTLDLRDPTRYVVAAQDPALTTGKVTWEQFAVELQLVFDNFDVDRDGQLDAAEIASFAAARKAQEESR